MSKSIEEISLMCANWWADRLEPITLEERNKYVPLLSEYLTRVLPGRKKAIVLGGKLRPCAKLIECARKAGINYKRYAMPTMMSITENHVSIIGLNDEGRANPPHYLYLCEDYIDNVISMYNNVIGSCTNNLRGQTDESNIHELKLAIETAKKRIDDLEAMRKSGDSSVKEEV